MAYNKEILMIIYKTLNTVNGKYYIGLDTKNNPNYLGSGTLLKKAIKKYGKESFNKIVLEQCTSIEQLKEQEKYWIGVYNACSDRSSYNISTGGTGGDNFSHNPNKEHDTCFGSSPLKENEIAFPFSPFTLCSVIFHHNKPNVVY